MNSIRIRLLLWLTVAAVSLSLLTGGGLYLSLRRMLVSAFDQTLRVRAESIAASVTRTAEGKLDVDAAPAIERKSHEYFEIRDADGTIVLRSTETANVPGFSDVASGMIEMAMPDGHRGRVIRMSFVPAPEHEAETSPNGESPDARDTGAPAATTSQLTITLIRDSESLRATVRRAGLIVLAAVGVLSAAMVGAAMLIVRHGLRRLDALATEAMRMEFARADAHFRTDDTPAELKPIVRRLNELLGRGRNTLERQRRFSADVAHELRTPLAELRLAADVAARMPRDIDMQHRAVRQAGEIAVQMQAMVTTLSHIIESDERRIPLKLVPVTPGPLLPQSAARHAALAAERGISVALPDTDSAASLCALADVALLTAVIDNLMSNACRYASPHTTVRIALRRSAESLAIDFNNEDMTLTDDDLAQLFDPFWRKDEARSQGDHVGLGLTLTRSFCEAMGGQVGAVRPAAGQIRITVTLSLALPASLAASRPTFDGATHPAAGA